MKDTKIRVLFTLSNLSQANGILSFCWNYLSFFDYSRVEISVLSTDFQPSEAFLSFCQKKNISVTLLSNPKKAGYFALQKQIDTFFEGHHDFDIVHCNTANYGFLFLNAAKKYGIPVRIFHSHNSQYSESVIKRPLDAFGVQATKKAATVYCACSEKAGRFTFGELPFHVIHNAIDQTKFSYSPLSRQAIRNKYGIPDSAFVLGFVGRLDQQKNPLFLLDVLRCFLKTNSNTYLLIVGDGRLREKMAVEAKQKEVVDRLVFAGTVSDCSSFYSAFDCFLLPSLFEGLVVSGVEAQAVGLPCLFSEGSSSELIYKTNAEIYPLSKGPENWSREISKLLPMKSVLIPDHDWYDIRKESMALIGFYESLVC